MHTACKQSQPPLRFHCTKCCFTVLHVAIILRNSSQEWRHIGMTDVAMKWHYRYIILSLYEGKKNTYPFVGKNFFHWKNTPNSVWSKHTHSQCLLLSHLLTHIFIPITDGGTRRTWSPIFSTKIKFWFHYAHLTYLKKACLKFTWLLYPFLIEFFRQVPLLLLYSSCTDCSTDSEANALPFEC